MYTFTTDAQAPHARRPPLSSQHLEGKQLGGGARRVGLHARREEAVARR
jgi:hypothetical protein